MGRNVNTKGDSQIVSHGSKVTSQGFESLVGSTRVDEHSSFIVASGFVEGIGFGWAFASSIIDAQLASTLAAGVAAAFTHELHVYSLFNYYIGVFPAHFRSVLYQYSYLPMLSVKVFPCIIKEM
jgi:hypothetical protein